MKIPSPDLLALAALSAAAAIGLGVVVEHSTLHVPPTATSSTEAASEAEFARLTPGEQLSLMLAVAQSQLQRKDYPGAIGWARRYVQAGGVQAEVRPLLSQAYYELGDYANAARELQWLVQSSERDGAAPDEDRLLRLKRCYAELSDATAEAWVLEKLVTHHPRPPYWSELLELTAQRSDMGEPQALFINRLRLLTGTLGPTAGYLQLAEQARRAGYPVEGRHVIEQGVASGVLARGPFGSRVRHLLRQLADEAQAQQRRIGQPEVERAAEKARDGIALFDIGYAYVVAGNPGKGFGLMERGLAKGGFAGRPQYARLQLGIAYLMAGRKADALEAFGQVSGRHAAPDLARLWGLYARGIAA